MQGGPWPLGPAPAAAGGPGQYQLLNAATPDPVAAAWRTTRRGPSTSSAASASGASPIAVIQSVMPERTAARSPSGRSRASPYRGRAARTSSAERRTCRTSRGAVPSAEDRGRGTGPRPGWPSGRSPRRVLRRSSRASRPCSRPASRPRPRCRRRRGRPRRGRRTGRRPAWAPRARTGPRAVRRTSPPAAVVPPRQSQADLSRRVPVEGRTGRPYRRARSRAAASGRAPTIHAPVAPTVTPLVDCGATLSTG